MKTPRSEIADAIAAHTYHGGLSKEYAREIAAFLMDEGRVDELDSLLRDIQAIWQLHGHVEALAYTAHPLTPEVHAEIIERVKQMVPGADEFVVTEVIDPEVVGGVKIRLANQQLDLSVESKLNKFKQLTAAGKE
jgi:F-type H+-transporting ATPase subunit delta